MPPRVTEAQSNNEQIVFRDYPVILWPFGVLALLLGVGLPETILVRLVFVLLGVAAIGFLGILTVAVDHTRGTLSLHYRALFRRSTKVYALNDICFVNVVDDGGEGTYRIELTLRSGEVVPLRSGYTAGKASKERLAKRLRSELHLVDGFSVDSNRLRGRN